MLGVDDRPRELLIKTELDAAGFVRVTVRDSGIGFDPRDGQKLFTAFYTTKPQGMGIGLSVSRSIIECHHGRIWAVANEGPGATFSFAIPAVLNQPKTRAAAVRDLHYASENPPGMWDSQWTHQTTSFSSWTTITGSAQPMSSFSRASI